MKFSELVKQAITLLQESRRITYRALKLEFDLNQEQLEAVKDELIKAKRLAVDEDGEVLVWAGTDAESEKEKRGKSEREAVS
jgi:transposase-like protein